MINDFRRRLKQYASMRAQNKQLLEMGDRTLTDLAISRVDAEQLAGLYRSANVFQRGDCR